MRMEMHETCASYICRKQAPLRSYISADGRCNRNRMVLLRALPAAAAAARRSESGFDVVAVLLRRGGLQIEDAMATRMGMRTAVASLVQLRCGRVDARK